MTEKLFYESARGMKDEGVPEGPLRQCCVGCHDCASEFGFGKLTRWHRRKANSMRSRQQKSNRPSTWFEVSA